MLSTWSIRTRLLAIATTAFVSLVLATCGPKTPDAEMGAVPTTVTPGSAGAGQVVPTETVSALTATPAEPIAGPSAALEDESVVALVKADLAQRLGVAEKEIAVESFEAIQWPDTSLGCPQAGMMYAQVITPGYRVVLEVDGQVYEVHTGEGQHTVWCEEEGAVMEVPPVPGTVEPGLEGLIDLAREDLAGRLSIDVDEIEVLEAKGVVWPDAGLGCPQPGMRYRQVPMDGALIRLQVEGKVYEYHSGGGREPFLCEQPLKLQKDTVPQIDLLKLTPGSPND